MFSKRVSKFVSLILVIVSFSFLLAGCTSNKDGDATYECKTSDGTIVFYRHELTEEEKKTTTTVHFTLPPAEGNETTKTTVSTTVNPDEKVYEYYYIKDGERIVLDTGTYKDSKGTVHVISLGFAKGYYNAFKTVKIIAIILAIVLVFGVITVVAYKGVQYEENQKKLAREQNKKNKKKK